MLDWSAARLLVLPIAPVFRPASDSEVAREARRRAWEDRDAGTFPTDWPDWPPDDWQRFREVLRAYWPARHPDRLVAPAWWPEEVALQAAATLLSAFTQQRLSWRSIPLFLAWRLHNNAQTAARHRSARRQGLTPRTAPEIRFSPSLLPALLLLPVDLWIRRRRRNLFRPLSWEARLAIGIVYALSERRAYRAALRRP